jgi:hypothetical protein
LSGGTEWNVVDGLPDIEGMAGVSSEHMGSRTVSGIAFRFRRDLDDMYPTALQDKYSVYLPPRKQGERVRILGKSYKVVAISDPTAFPHCTVRLAGEDRDYVHPRVDSSLTYDIPIDDSGARVATLHQSDIHVAVPAKKVTPGSLPNVRWIQFYSPLAVGDRIVQRYSVQTVHAGQILKIGDKYHRLTAINLPNNDDGLYGWCEISQAPCVPTADDDVCKNYEGVTERHKKSKRKVVGGIKGVRNQ